MTGIDRSVILTEILPFLILKVSSVKDDCDRIIGDEMGNPYILQ